MKIGELAKKTNLSVRTLHYYDEINLLKPNSKSNSGHRHYTEADLKRLHIIVSLKSLNISLDSIREVLNESKTKLIKTITEQIELVQEEVESQKLLLNRLSLVAKDLETKEELDFDNILKTVNETTLLERYLSADEILFIQKKFSQSSEIDKFQKNWDSFISEIKDEMQKGTPADCVKIKNFAKQWIDYKKYWLSEAPEETKKVKKMQEDNPQMLQDYGLNQDVIDYIQKAANCLHKG